MASGTSYFNSTIYRKDLTRFWPLWTLWGVFWLFVVPLNMLNRYFDVLKWGESLTKAQEDLFFTATTLPQALSLGVWTVCGFSILAAMAVFGYLCNNRSAAMMHALPVRRETLFFTNYLAGLSFLLLPLAAVAFITLVTEMILLPAGPYWGQALYGLLAFFLPMAGMSVFFFSFAAFCAMFTGHILALPVFYGILNWLVWVVHELINLLFQQFFYGYAGVATTAWVTYCTPIYALYDACQWVSNPGETVWQLNSPEVVAAYTGAGLVLTVLAMFLYRIRHIESAGDVVSVSWVRPIFKYGVALCSGLCLGVFTAAFFGWANEFSAGLAGSVLVWTAVGYFAAEMLLKKSFRVWKAWAGGVAAVAVMGVLCVCCALDLFGIESRVPSVDSVKSVTVHGDIGYPYDDGQINMSIDDLEKLQKVMDLHRAIIQEKGRAGQEGGDDYIYLSVDYELNNGSSLQRRYHSVPIYRDELEQENTVTWCARALIEDRELVEQAYDFDNYESGRLTEASLEDVWDTSVAGFTGFYLDQSAGELQELWQAVRLDFEEGNIGVHTLFDQEEHGVAPKLNFYWTMEEPEVQLGTYASAASSREDSVRTERFTIALVPQATHTMAWLEARGLPGAGYELFSTGR